MTTNTITAHDIRWTVADVLALNPCEDYRGDDGKGARLYELWAGRESLGIAEVCDLNIPAEDRLWLLTQAPFEVIEPAILAIVERAIRNHVVGCGIEAVEQWAAKWLDGSDRSEDAAWAASGAAGAASGDAAWAAARAAAWAAERRLQIADFRALVEVAK